MKVYISRDDGGICVWVKRPVLDSTIDLWIERDGQDVKYNSWRRRGGIAIKPGEIKEMELREK